MVHRSMQTTWTASSQAGGAGQPVRGVIGGAALYLPQHPLLAVQVEEAGVPPVRQQGVLPGLLIEGPGQHRLLDPAGDHAASRARRRRRVIGDRPYFQRAARPGLHVGDPQAFRPEQRRRLPEDFPLESK